jgi:hypothetical protein
MFVFNAKRVLLRQDTAFSKINMQAISSEWGGDEDYFADIDFAKVYHEGPIGGDRNIIQCRCAEVLAKSPLPLKNNLEWIICRSQPERHMLLEMLGEYAPAIEPYVRVSDDISVLEKQKSYVEEIGIQLDGVVWRLNPRKDGQKSLIQVTVRDATGSTVISYGPRMLPPFPPKARKWISRHPLAPGRYNVEVLLEGCLAYKGTHSLAEDPF